MPSTRRTSVIDRTFDGALDPAPSSSGHTHAPPHPTALGAHRPRADAEWLFQRPTRLQVEQRSRLRWPIAPRPSPRVRLQRNETDVGELRGRLIDSRSHRPIPAQHEEDVTVAREAASDIQDKIE